MSDFIRTLGTNKYFSINEASKHFGVDFQRLPRTMKVVLENLLRSLYIRPEMVRRKEIEFVIDWLKARTSDQSISLFPTRILMQDYTGVPSIVDLASMRDAAKKLGGDPEAIKPMVPVDLIVDHSVQVDFYGSADSFAKNCSMEMHRNAPRYEFLKWGAQAFKDKLRIVPPGKGICHQVNLESLAQVVWNDGEYVYPDSLIGLDSHTTMVNSLGVLGWGVGGIEAEAVMLGQPISMILPEVIGVRMSGYLRNGVNATDLVLTVTNLLRKRGVVGKFVEFFGEGAKRLTLADRATVANMAPEYGATCGFFPVDEKTLDYLRVTGRSEQLIALVESYTKEQGLWLDETEPVFTDTLDLDLGTVDSCLAGPKRPQDLLPMKDLTKSLSDLLDGRKPKNVSVGDFTLSEGDIVIAAITSCTNTSNPDAMIGAGLVAQKAYDLGLKPKPFVKTSLAPGSRSVVEYLKKSGLNRYLDYMGFYLVGYGCTTCIGNSGPLMPDIEEAIRNKGLVVSSVLSGNRNFEGRIHPLVQANYLASPPLVVALSIAGTIMMDFDNQPIAKDRNGKDVYLREIMPTNEEIRATVSKYVDAKSFSASNIFSGTSDWDALDVKPSSLYPWDTNNLYIQNPPYFDNMEKPSSINNARVLALLGDSVTTDHISPAGNIAKNSPAASFLMEHGVKPEDFNTYGARRGNHNVMVRGTLANVRIRNRIEGVTKEGGYTLHMPSNDEMFIYDAAMLYQKEDVPTVIIAGKEYGSGSSRDWAAKGVKLLGVTAVIAESFERIHRSNLIGMGILPLEFIDRPSDMTGHEVFSIKLDTIRAKVAVEMQRPNGEKVVFHAKSRIDTDMEEKYYKSGGILRYALNNILGA